MKMYTPAIKKISYQGLDAYLPVIIESDQDIKKGLSIKKIIINGDPLATRQAALKYAEIVINDKHRGQ